MRLSRASAKRTTGAGAVYDRAAHVAHFTAAVYRNRIARLMWQGQIPLCLPREDSLAMALYDELVRRGEISMPPQRVMQLGFPASVYEWVGSPPR